MSRFPVRPRISVRRGRLPSELYEEQKFKAENDCDETACEPKWDGVGVRVSKVKTE